MVIRLKDSQRKAMFAKKQRVTIKKNGDWYDINLNGHEISGHNEAYPFSSAEYHANKLRDKIKKQKQREDFINGIRCNN